ncbi:MAG: hypothetical protein ABSF48_28355, partial [Thermodesulfobacteriota bacterium]
MEYISTRGGAPSIRSKKAIIKGIAEDNGLYVPSGSPSLGPNPFSGLKGNSYAGRATAILEPFLTDYREAELLSACQGAYGENFGSPLTAPVKFLNDGTSVLELWHGPTQAFKDMALQLMPRLLSLALKDEEEKYEVVILVATSGDTGKAALEGFANAEGVRIFVFYPHEGVSEIQRLQMVTQRGVNVGACAVKGNFDDAQTGVKEIFSAQAINQKLAIYKFRLSSANSINWGRLAPQVAYYFTGYDDMVKAKNLPYDAYYQKFVAEVERQYRDNQEYRQWLNTGDGKSAFYNWVRFVQWRGFDKGLDYATNTERQPQVLVEGGELVPCQYRYLTGWMSDPLPEYSLLALPAVVSESGEHKIDSVLKQLKEGVEGIQQSDQFRLFLSTMAKFHDYSIGNLILIMIQKPEATHVAGFNTWKDL